MAYDDVAGRIEKRRRAPRDVSRNDKVRQRWYRRTKQRDTIQTERTTRPRSNTKNERNATASGRRRASPRCAHRPQTLLAPTMRCERDWCRVNDVRGFQTSRGLEKKKQRGTAVGTESCLWFQRRAARHQIEQCIAAATDTTNRTTNGKQRVTIRNYFVVGILQNHNSHNSKQQTKTYREAVERARRRARATANRAVTTTDKHTNQTVRCANVFEQSLVATTTTKQNRRTSVSKQHPSRTR